MSVLMPEACKPSVAIIQQTDFNHCCFQLLNNLVRHVDAAIETLVQEWLQLAQKDDNAAELKDYHDIIALCTRWMMTPAARVRIPPCLEKVVQRVHYPSPGPLSFRRPETLPNKTTTLSRHGSHHYTQPSNHAAPVTTWLPLPIPTSQLTPPTHPLLDDPHCPKPTLHEQTPYLRPPPARRLPTTACTHHEPRPISPQNGNWSPKHDDDDDYYPRGRRPREDE